MTSPALIHVLSLDTVGGVESLYVHFITEALSQGSSRHFTSICGKPPHRKFLTHFEKLGYRPFLEEHIMGIRLPRFLRGIARLRRSMVEDIVKPTFWVYWNRIEEYTPPGKTIYYEHGAAWNVPVSKKRLKFFSNCSAYIANSNAAAIILKDKWRVTAPVTVIPNPLRPDIGVIDTPKSLSSLHPLRLGFIGRLVSVKGLPVAIHALKLLIDRGIPATLTIAGVGPLEPAARAQVTALGVEPFVFWKGCLDSVTGFYDNIDVLLVPSVREPLGLVALEASARGVPVVATAVDGLPEAVLDGMTGLCVRPTLTVDQARKQALACEPLPDLVVDPTGYSLQAPKIMDPEHCAAAIERLIKDQELYTKLSAGGICHAKSRADFHAYFNALQNILEYKQTDSNEGEGSPSSDSEN